jgi:hypothetical protein
MKALLFSLFFFYFVGTMSAQQPTVYTIESQPNATVEVSGDLADGMIMEDLSWAWSSQNACFPATQSQKFTGNHVLYLTQLPSYSEMEVTVIPDDPNADFSIYAYQTGTGADFPVVPNLYSCVRCEADHKWDYKYRGKTQDHTRTVRNLTAIANPYQVVIGVVGSQGLQSGGYTLQITMKSR